MKISLDSRALDVFGICAAMAAFMTPGGSIANVFAWIALWARAFWLFEGEFDD